MEEKYYNRREALCKIGKTLTGLVATLSFPSIATASQSPYPYKTPTSREDLYNIPKNHLLARTIFGEADSCVPDEQIAIAYTAINRLHDNKSYNGQNSLTEVLLHIQNGRHQYDCFKDISTDLNLVTNFQRTLDPARYDMKNWRQCLEMANQVIANKHPKLNKKQTSYVTNWKIKECEKSKKTPSWFSKSAPVLIDSPYAHLFEHEFIE